MHPNSVIWNGGGRTHLNIILVSVIGIVFSAFAAPSLEVASGSQSIAQGVALDPIPCPPPTSPEIPPPPGCEVDHTAAAENFCLRLATKPESAAAPGQVMSYEITTFVTGRRGGNRLTLRLPFAPNWQELVDARFNRSEAWVSAVLTDAVVMQLGNLDRNEIITATVRLRVRSTAGAQSALSTRVTMDWSNSGAASSLISNRVDLTVSRKASSAPVAMLVVTPRIGARGDVFAASDDGFTADELVGLWYNSPNGKVVTIDTRRADGDGQIAVELPASDLAPGEYQVVAFGHCSQRIVTGYFRVVDD